MYDPSVKRRSYKFFKADFLISIAVLVTLGLIVWLPFFILEAHHHTTVEQAKLTTLKQNHFWSAVEGSAKPTPNSNLAKFVDDLVKNNAKVSAADLTTPKNFYGPLAYNWRTDIWGVDKNVNDVTVADNYHEGGQFSDVFLKNLHTIYFGSAAQKAKLTNAPIQLPGNIVPPVAWWQWIVLAELIGSCAYVVAAYDREENTKERTFFSIVRPNTKSTPLGKSVMTVIAFPVVSVLWAAMWKEQYDNHLEGKRIMAELNNPVHPMYNEVQEAQKIVDYYKKNPEHLDLPEVKSAFEMANATLEAAKHAPRHIEQVEARKLAVEHLATLAPVAERTREFHDELHESAKEHIVPRMTELMERYKKALGGGANELGSGEDKTPPAASGGNPSGPITPDVLP